ncbi:MAG: hypothetical protein A2X61_02950 [Ignavibacteria bacterium GWB2_35_12]|nr:MAG: hypothetical protein A2X63_11605 [Ignavibacteria bacterium GWA2_35_8]OGU38250.1 MAG: hypothetical protein A2X61_02950 [Ignavibacteria bacterium GWB2_35_12]OGU95471.1 MAG: hypothetical protein A2220_07125 [Ignavibacteria bacterium RIFOXYA2_FULL_35_10]OGV20813.1 MAG: hypothetical protein A2475_11600 [Ignavibacteria bacterium RIFOXYC2_FULL_35_21]
MRTITTPPKNNRNLRKTNYEEYRDKMLDNPEFKAMYILAKEKLQMELMIDSIKESILQKKDEKIIMRHLNKLSRHIGKIAL